MWMANREHELFMISQVVILQHSFGRRTFCCNTVLLQASEQKMVYELKNYAYASPYPSPPDGLVSLTSRIMRCKAIGL